MARINTSTITKKNKDRVMLHERVDTTYSIFDINKEHFVQIDTYGKSDRETPEKLSQSIQLDYESAKFLVDLLKAEFGL